MERYQFDETTKKTLEQLRTPLAVYQFLNQKVSTLLVSDGFCDLLGIQDRERAIYMMDHNMYELTHPDDKAWVANEAVAFALNGEKYDVIYRSRTYRSEEYRILHATGEHVRTEDGVQLAYIWYTDEGAYFAGNNVQQFSVTNALRRVLHEKSVINSGNYDVLTGLPTMSYFFELVNQRRRSRKGNTGRVAVLYMNLFGMKHYNRKFGFAEGDNLLKRFAGILNRVFGKDNCSRFGSDHFAVITDMEGVEELLNTVFNVFRTHNAGPSLPVGVGIYSEIDGVLAVSAECDRAKYACDAIRNTSISGFRYFNQNMLVQVEKSHYFIDNLKQAIRKNWIEVYYQPIVRSANGRVCEEEALARWNDPARGVISPAEFIPVLEEAKLIYKLDLYVAEQVIKKIKIQEKEGLFVVPNSVNLSRSDFDACDIVEEIRRRVDAAGISRSNLTIEITESAVGKDFAFMKTQIERFRELGFHVWMDDFGNEYSALDTLLSIHFDLIKFDMRFMKQFSENAKSRIMLAELMRMAISLGMDTVCEGVETAEQVDFLREIGCTMMQGYYFCRPIPLDRILERYRTGTQIGFENPEESAYYAAIGRINLYDLAIMSNDDKELFSHYFNTIPMAILETTSDHFTLVRCNSTYRSFLMDLIGTLPLGKPVSFEEGDGITNKSFLAAIKACANEESKILIDDALPNGTVMHSFLKFVAANPVTHTKAIAIAILTVSKDEKSAVSFTHIANALSSDYIRLYDVDLRTGKFIEYSAAVNQEDVSVERHGDDLFAQFHRNAPKMLHPDDADAFIQKFTKERILRSINADGSFTMSYRLMIDGKPSDVNLKAVRVQAEENHIIIGLTKKNKLEEAQADRGEP